MEGVDRRSDTEVVGEGCGRGDNWLGRGFQLPCAYLDVRIIPDNGDGVEDGGVEDDGGGF